LLLEKPGCLLSLQSELLLLYLDVPLLLLLPAMLYALLVLMLLLLLLLLLLDPFKPDLVNPGVLLLWLLLPCNVDVLLVTFADGLLQLHNLI